MNAIPQGMVDLEKNNTEVVHEIEDGIVEVGAVVTDTKGGIWGHSIDNGMGWQFP